jgi:hypothetical protein
MPAIGTTTYTELGAALEKVGAKLTASEVHVLYLGAQTSTSFGLGPQRLFDTILGDDADLGEDPIAPLNAIMGYWNTLVSERKAGRVRLPPLTLPASPTKAELLAYATARQDQLAWYPRGMDAGGDDPIELGPPGQILLEGIAEASAHLQTYVEMLEKPAAPDAETLRGSREVLLELEATVERFITKLIDVSDAVRREALDAYAARSRDATDDGMPITRGPKVGRNERCPCGSGKKWKRCCGAPERLQ